MGQLTNQYVSQSYQGLLKLDDSATGVTSTLQYVQDGVGNNLPIQVSTSSVNITGSFYGDGSGLTGVTAVVDSGSLVTTSSFNAFTASIDGRVDALELETGSLQNQINQKLDTGSFNSYTSSTDGRLSSLEVETGSLQLQINQKLDTGSFNSYTSSNDAKVNALINATGSYATTSSLTSISQSIAVTDLAQDGRLNSLETATGSLQNQINQKLDSGSFNAYTSSNDAKVDSLINATGSYATTGSNTFNGDQTISTGYKLIVDEINPNGSDINVTGSLHVTNQITALSASITFLETIYQTSSVIFTSGSNILGDEAGDIQTLNGRVDIPLGDLNVTGITTIQGGSVGKVNLLGHSGSLVVGAGSPSYSGLNHISSSTTTLSNIYLRDNSTAASTVISGSGNIFTTPSSPTTGFRRYMTSYNEFLGGTSVPQITGSMTFSPTVSYNIGATQGASFIAYGPATTASPWSVISNVFAGGQGISFGTAANPMNNISGAVQITGNYLGNGTINAKGYGTSLTGPFNIVGNSLINGLANLNAYSSSINFNANALNATVNVDNAYTPVGGTITPALASRTNFNLLYGNNHSIQFSGSNVSTLQTKQFAYNLVQGEFITASVGDGDSSNIMDVAIVGHNLIVSGSSTAANANALYTLDNTHGSAFFGRFNSLDGNKAKTAETVFAVGTGTQSSRKTGFLIDSGSNVHIDGTLTVSGSANVTGSLTASGLIYPINDGVADMFLETDGNGNLIFDWVKTLHQNIRNADSVTINRGTPLFVSGATGDNADVYVADADNPLRRPATLIAFDATLAPSATGTAIISGEIQGVDTNAYPAGTVIYLAAGGGWTDTRPTGSASVQPLGVVTRQNNNGRGIVFNQIANALPNLQEGYVWVGNSDGVPVAISTGSFIEDLSIYTTTASFNAYTSSNDGKVDALIAATGSYATTGSNTFIGNQVITGSLYVSSSAANDVTVEGKMLLFSNAGAGNATSLVVSGAYANAGTSTINAGTILASSGSYNGILSKLAVTHTDATGAPTTNKYVGFSANPSIIGAPSVTGTTVPSILAMNDSSQPEAVISFQHRGAYTDGTITMLKPVDFKSGSIITGSLQVTNGITGSLEGTASYATNALSSSHSINADTASFLLGAIASASYADYAVSSSQAENANLLDGKDSSEFAITGSNIFVGDQTITGSLSVSGSLHTVIGNTYLTGTLILSSSNANDLLVEGRALVRSSGTGGDAAQVQVSGSTLGTTTIQPASVTLNSGSLNATFSKFLINHTDTTGVPTTNKYLGFSANPSLIGAPTLTGTTVPSILAMSGSNQVEPVISFQHRGAYTDGTITILKPLALNSGSLISGSLTVSGSATITGSVQGNVNALSISSNTASLNLNDGNFFTLQLVEGTDTRIEPSNIKAGQTINVKLNTTGSATVSFPSSVKQASGSAYVPTTTTGTDIITMVSFDGSDLYLANVKNLI